MNDSNRNSKTLQRRSLVISLLMFTIVSCDDFLDVGPPKAKVTDASVFSDESTAVSAVLGIYYKMYGSGKFASGGERGVSTLTGLSSDELKNYPQTDAVVLQFERNELQGDNPLVLALWNSLYETLFQANAVLEGINSASQIPNATINQLTGEVLFIRAFCHFYLLNLFGDVPLVITTDYRLNSSIARTASEDVYNQIVTDLQRAIEVLRKEYPTNERIRPNRFAAVALLSRVQLFMGNWSLAEHYATEVIEDGAYIMEDLSTVFLSGSQEAIWQLRPPSSNAGYTSEGFIFNDYNAPRNNVLRADFVDIYSPEDERLTNWLRTIEHQSDFILLPYKYKDSSAGDLEEYSVVLRLAEQYLIRAEARARQNNIDGGLEDLNVIRSRASLTQLDLSDKEELLMEVFRERRRELFTEWGHRWFDLKRTGAAVSELDKEQPVSPHALLYPVPEGERSKNGRLEQNPGY